MRNVTEVYLYDSTQEANGYKGTDYSQYVLSGDSSTDNLDDTLDSYELTLAGLPFRDEFAPSTKFIIIKYSVDDEGNVLSTPTEFDVQVNSDTVVQPILSNSAYFDHHISFYEASIDAQQRLVDNISVTYKLKDVNLNVEPSYPVDENAPLTIQNVDNIPLETFNDFGGAGLSDTVVVGHKFIWIMPDWYTVNIDGQQVTPDWSYWENFKRYQEFAEDDPVEKLVQLPVPMLQCFAGTPGTKNYGTYNGCCSIDITVTEYNTLTGDTVGTVIKQITVNPDSTDSNEGWTKDPYSLNTDIKGAIVSRPVQIQNINNAFSRNISLVAEYETGKNNRVLEFNIKKGYNYSIYINRHPFQYDSTNVSEALYDIYPCWYAYGWFQNYFIFTSWDTDYRQINQDSMYVNMKFNAIAKGGLESIYLRSAPAANAYELYRKAVIASQTTLRKSNGGSVDDLILPYYLEDDDKYSLQTTEIIENFYNQKNLWEIMMDVGKYIHARPKNYFGSDNRYVTRWKKYGLTEQYQDNGTRISIYNSRFIDEYISACSSYVSNMVQLGGIITETLCAKSSSEDYLVYNDVAELIVSKPIIEIVSLIAKEKTKDGTAYSNSADITQYVFEKSIYNVLDIVDTSSVNKGLAIYYELGDTKIQGFTYTLPEVSTGTNNTAIKNILGTAFGLPESSWESINVNDFDFEISYRTKDTLRTDQTRPDLRKYLLSSKYDRVPQHNQFNNQEDTLIDSEKFGINIYGKLIRTGNTVYSAVEWVDNITTLKHSGELYNIFGNLYYVSKVINTYYPDHIESQVEYSKDFNRLAEIIGIPSEPRFYEISERSSIDREISVSDYVLLSTSDTIYSRKNLLDIDCFVSSNGVTFIAKILFDVYNKAFPQYAVTYFKNDKDKAYADTPGNEIFSVAVMSPIVTYSLKNTITFEWDMVDNFSAGDKVKNITVTGQQEENQYKSLEPFRYKDVYGRADMFDFAIVDDIVLTPPQVQELPESSIDINTGNYNVLFGNEATGDYGKNDRGIAALFDNREVAKINYNLQMLTISDRFVLSSYLWQKKTSTCYIALLNSEVNKLSNNKISDNDFIYDNIAFEYSISPFNFIEIKIAQALNLKAAEQSITIDELLQNVKSIVIYESSLQELKNFVIARNITDLATDKSIKDWIISMPPQAFYSKQ